MFRKHKFKYSSTYYRRIKQVKQTNENNNENFNNTSDLATNTSDLATEHSNLMLLHKDLSTISSNQQVLENAAITSTKDTPVINEISDNEEDSKEHENDSDHLQMNKISRINNSLREDLQDWSLSYNISHQALTGLLKLLRNNGITSLPQDSRTLLHTIKSVEIYQMGQGEFWHHGISVGLNQMLTDVIKENTAVKLNFHIDGLPLTNSSKQQYWPILMSVINISNTRPGPVCIYCGTGKPLSAELFMERFVLELNELLENGLMINGHFVSVYVSSILCDTPARCFIKCKYAENIFFNGLPEYYISYHLKGLFSLVTFEVISQDDNMKNHFEDMMN